MVKSLLTVEEETNNTKSSFNLTINEISLLVDRVKAKTLFDINYSASDIQKLLKPRQKIDSSEIR